MITEGTTYHSTDADWVQNALCLVLGDDIEYWDNENRGARGKLIAYEHDGLGAEGCWRSIIGSKGHPGEVDPHITEFTVRSLAPRDPSWAGAELVMDRDGDVWQLKHRHDNTYVRPGTSNRATARTIEINFHPITVLIDANGRIPIDSVMSINGVSRAELSSSLRCVDAWITSTERREIADALIDALGGAR